MSNEDDLWDMSDEALEAAYKEAQAESQSPDTGIDDETYTEEINDGPEQLEDDLEDSSHDTSTETETEEVDAEDDPKLEDEASKDEDPVEDEEDSSEDTDEEEVEEQPAQSYKFKANGKDYEFSSEEIVDQFPKIFGQAMDYTKKMQSIKPWRKTIDAIEGAKLNHDDVSLMIDVLKGDKNAISEVLKRTGVDTLDLDSEEDSKYVAKDYGRDDSALAIKDIVEDISRDVEYATTENIISKEWDEQSWQAMAKTPEMIRLLHTDVKSGMYAKVQPLAEKLKVYGGGTKSDLEYYKEAAQQHFAKIAQDDAYSRSRAARQTSLDTKQADKAKLDSVRSKSDQRTATKEASSKRRAAAPTKNVIAGRDVVDYLDTSDEAFDDWYKNLQDET
jgi:YHS domain-containing protein